MTNIDLIPLFSNVNGNNIISIDTVTCPKLKGGRSNPLQGKVFKVMTRANVMVFSHKNSNGYENMVLRRLMKEGKDPNTFNLGVRPWGTRVPETPVIEHNGDQYLEVIFLRPGKVAYVVDGEEVDPATIEGLPESKEGEQGGLDDKVIIRTFRADSIFRITIDGLEVSERGLKFEH